MNLGKRRKPDHVQGGLQVLLGLAGEPDDDVRRQGKRWIIRTQALHTAEQVLRRVRSTHALQHRVTPALQGKMQLRTQRGMVRKRTDQCFRDRVRVQGADAYARREACSLKRSQHVVQQDGEHVRRLLTSMFFQCPRVYSSDTRGTSEWRLLTSMFFQCKWRPPVLAYLRPGQHHFLDACRRKPQDLVHYTIDRLGFQPRAMNKRYHAIGAHIVAALLNAYIHTVAMARSLNAAVDPSRSGLDSVT